MRDSTRVAALFTGFFGAVVAFVVNMLYSLLHMPGRISGITADRSHFFIGTLLAILALVGSMLVVGTPEVGAVLLVLATIGLLAILGWWAIIPAVFLVVAAGLAFVGREERHRPTTTAPN